MSKNLLVYSDYAPKIIYRLRSVFCSMISHRIEYLGHGLTFNRLAVLGSITLRISRTSCVRDEPTWPCFIMKDLGTPSFAAAAAAGPWPLR